MSKPSPTGRSWPEATRPLDEMRRQARLIANFAEYLAADVRGHPERTREATEALAAWCNADLELLAHARTDLLRHRREGPPGTMADNRYAIQLYLADSAA